MTESAEMVKSFFMRDCDLTLIDAVIEQVSWNIGNAVFLHHLAVIF